MTTTAPIQAPSSSANAPRAGKSSANTSGTPFDSVLSQEVAQRHSESTSPQTAKSAQAAPASTEVKRKPDGTGKSTERDAEAANTASAPELLALVADIARLTGKGALSGAEAAATTTADRATDALAHDTKRGKSAGFDLGKAGQHDKAGVLQDRTLLSAADARHTASSNAAQVADFAAGMMQRVSSGTERAIGDTGAHALESSLSPSSSASLVPMQQAVASFAAQTVAPSADKLTPPVGTPAWDQALGNRVVWMAGSDMQSASLSLNPPDLGPLQVVLNVANNQASATFSAAQPEVRQALEAAMPKLREMLEEAGIQLGQATVDAGTPNRQDSSDRQPQYGSRMNDGENKLGGTESVAATPRQAALVRGQGLVDTFA